MKTAYKLFSDPQMADEALAALRSGGYPAEAIGVLVRKGNGNPAAAGAVEVGTLADVGAIAAVGAEVFGLAGGQAGADASAAIAGALGLPEEAVATFTISLMRDAVLVAVREGDGLPDAQQLLRRAEPANVRIPKQQNEGFELAERRTATNPSDGQFSGDFRQY